ncbi:MAG: ArnT family glycosyltransferase [Planctomycetota bacterium]|jgi:hypothetical protein
MSFLTVVSKVFSSEKKPKALFFCLLLAFIMLAGFCLPFKKLNDPWGTGHSGSNNAMTSNICRSYHRAPLEAASLIPAIYREEGRKAEHKDMYYSHYPWIYIGYAAVTKITGISEASIRLIAVSFSIIAIILLTGLLRKSSDWTAFAGVILFISSPLTLLYGGMAEHYIPIGICLLLAAWSYSEFINKKHKLYLFVLFSLPLAVSSPFMYVYFVIAVFISIIIIKKSLKKTIITCSILTLIWAAFFLLHLLIVKTAAGSIDPFFARGTARGILAAFQTQKNPINDIIRSFTERLGIPLTILLVFAVYTSFINRITDKGYYALVLTAVISSAGFIISFMQLVAVHRYALQLFLPLFAFICAPALVRFLSAENNRIKIIFGILLLATCAGMFAHRLKRWSYSDDYEVALSKTASEAGKIPGNDKIMMLVDKNVMGAWMSVQNYSGKSVVRRLTAELEIDNPNNYSAVIGTNVDNWIPILCEKYSLNINDFKIMKDNEGKPLGVFVWVNRQGVSNDRK